MLFGLFLLIFGITLCLLAFWQGEFSQRVAAGAILANFLMATVNYSTVHSQLIDLCIDGTTALVLLPLTMHYASFWLGAVMLIYAIQFGLDAYYLVLERHTDELHSTVNNADSFAIIVALAWGTAVGWLRRRRNRSVTGADDLAAA